MGRFLFLYSLLQNRIRLCIESNSVFTTYCVKRRHFRVVFQQQNVVVVLFLVAVQSTKAPY